MTTHATMRIDITDWQEKPYDEGDGLPRLAQAAVDNTYQGDLEGTGALQLLMLYRADDTAVYTGYERITGTLGGRSGSFVLRHTGTFVDGKAATTFEVVAGSGTDGFAGLTGTGGFGAESSRTVPEVTFDYDVD